MVQVQRYAYTRSSVTEEMGQEELLDSKYQFSNSYYVAEAVSSAWCVLVVSGGKLDCPTA